MEKKIAIILGIVAAVAISMIITRGKIWMFLVMGTLAYVIYKNNR